jgi:hypothetical protein
MNDREWIQLMNDELDGIARPEDTERLKRALESREDLRAQYVKLGGVFEALGCVGMEEPPGDLRQNVLRSIRQRVGAPARPGWFESIAAAFQARPMLRPAASFAAGAALGVLAFAFYTGNLTSRPGSDPRSFTGTMAPLAGTSYRVIDRRDFVLREGRVRAEMLSTKDLLVARISAQSPPGTSFVLSFDPGAWSAGAVRQDRAGNEVMLGSGRLSVRILEHGDSQYLLYLARTGPAGSPLRIAIHSPDGYVHGELETGAPRSGS